MNCNNCQNSITKNAFFCGKCGAKKEDSKSTFDYNIHIKKIALLFILLVTYIVSIHIFKISISKTNTIFIDIIFSLIVLLFSFYDRKTLKRVIQKPKIKIKTVLFILVLTPISAFIVHQFADLLNESLFHPQKIQTSNHQTFSLLNFLISILSIAIFPAIFEELAFRGVIFNELSKITSLKITIIISSILFTILHFSLISIIWIFPIGIILGYLRAKYRTIWYGILTHFVYNSCIIILGEI